MCTRNRARAGLGYRPQPKVEENLIRFTKGVANSTFEGEIEKKAGYMKYVKALDDFFMAYNDNNTDFKSNLTAGNLTYCNATVHADYQRACVFDLKSLGAPLCCDLFTGIDCR